MIILHSLRRLFYRLLGVVIVLYGTALLYMALEQNHFLYRSYDGPVDPVLAGAPQFTRKTLKAADGHTLVYWENASHGTTIFYFHGNGGGLWLHAPRLSALDQAGFHVIALEYPGYPGYAGAPSEAAILNDAQALYDAAMKKDPRVVFWGYSLGSGVAAQLALLRTPGLLVLEAPFTSAVDRAQEIYPYFPVHWLMHDQYRSRDAVVQLHLPILILQGDADQIIPVSHGKALYAAANEPKQLRIYPGYGHLDLLRAGAYADAAAYIHSKGF